MHHNERYKQATAIIFDMDSTLADNIPFHFQACLSFLRKHDIVLGPEEGKNLQGFM